MKPVDLLLLLFTFLAFSCQSSTLIQDVNIIDGTGNPLQTNMDVLIQKGKIQKIVKSNVMKDWGDVEVINASNRYLLPGLFDAHVHVATDPTKSDNFNDVKALLKVMLKNGITGVRDMAGDTRYLAYLSRQANLDEIVSPNIYYSSLMAGASFFDDPRTAMAAKGVTPGEAIWMRAVDMDSNFAEIVAQAKGTGASGIKLYADLPANVIENIISVAKEQSFPVWAHAAVIPSMPSDLVNSGISSLSHATLLAWESSSRRIDSAKQRYTGDALDVSDPAFVALLKNMKKNNVYLDATLAVFNDPDRKVVYNNGVAATRAAFATGIEIIIGTDDTPDVLNFDQLPIIDEMLALHEEAELPVLQVIKAASLNTARLLNIDHEQGSIEVGKVANILIINDNPIADLSSLKNVHSVYKNGQLVE